MDLSQVTKLAVQNHVLSPGPGVSPEGNYGFRKLSSPLASGHLHCIILTVKCLIDKNPFIWGKTILINGSFLNNPFKVI